ncbi:BTAD domain-containing putative transcriptional regulator [Kibdelosporangium persicum]|uniref:Transcriptional regulator n=1 Tax=Kibdelosporangium persicum TaxID=2698649 RepID=A0ABX2EUZ4_9PSEU|nr:BTAD domain-containing putative transcriptional regulator [Kibdelosporangium persicum]NRN62858.1 Transcriptional regulator [Kibdelosporangium persicum]
MTGLAERVFSTATQETAEQEARIIRLPTAAGQDLAAEPTGRATARVNMLGGFQLLVNGELVQVSLTGQRLLAVVACRPGPAVRSQVAHVLWPDTTSVRAHANLRTAVYRLERSCPGMLEATSSYLRLAPGITVDLDQTRELATRILATAGPLDPELVKDALEANLYDDLLPEWDEDWLCEHQSRYRQLRLSCLETLSQRLAESGHHGAAVHAALAAVHADSLRDSAHETLIRACLTQGNRHEAQTYFASYQRIFRTELGVEPAATIGQLLRTG